MTFLMRTILTIQSQAFAVAVLPDQRPQATGCGDSALNVFPEGSPPTVTQSNISLGTAVKELCRCNPGSNQTTFGEGEYPGMTADPLYSARVLQIRRKGNRRVRTRTGRGGEEAVAEQSQA